jgi:hypothetical protein
MFRKVERGSFSLPPPAGQRLYVRRSSKGTIELFRIPVAGGDAEKVPIPGGYELAAPPLSSAAVDARGRILVTVASSNTFFYRTAILDPARKSLTVVPVASDGDVSFPGWTSDGRIVANGWHYLTSLWRYRRLTVGEQR